MSTPAIDAAPVEACSAGAYADVHARLEAADTVRRAQLDAAIREGRDAPIPLAGTIRRAAVAVKTFTPPAPPAPPQESTMPRGGAHAPCPECQSTTKHRNGCSKPPRDGSPPAKAKAPAPRAAPKRRAVSRELETATVEQLVAQRTAALAGVAAIDAELRRRRDAIAEALSADPEAA